MIGLLFCLKKMHFPLPKPTFSIVKMRSTMYDHDFMTETPLFWALKAFVIAALLVEL